MIGAYPVQYVQGLEARIADLKARIKAARYLTAPVRKAEKWEELSATLDLRVHRWQAP